jgi:hypothetical protein
MSAVAGSLGVAPRGRLVLGVAVGVGFLALLLGLLALTGRDPLTVAWTMASYGFLDPNGRAETVVRAIPLCLMGLGVAIAFRAGAFNIGADGQLIAGSALAMAVVPFLVGLPGWVGAAAFLLVAAAGGGAWGGVAGWLRARFGANEIIVTIMLNYVALQLLSWLIRGPMQERMRMLPRSDALPLPFRLPVVVDGTRIHAGVWIALAATVLMLLGVQLALQSKPTSRVKGGEETVEFVIAGASGQRTAAPVETLAPGERVRVGVAGHRYAAAVSIDERGEVSTIYSEALEGPGRVWLPDSFEFTGSGKELVVVVVSDEAIDTQRLGTQLAERFKAGGDLAQLGTLDVNGVQVHRTFIKP